MKPAIVRFKFCWPSTKVSLCRVILMSAALLLASKRWGYAATRAPHPKLRGILHFTEMREKPKSNRTLTNELL